MTYEALRKWISHVHAQGRGDALFHEAAAEAEELLTEYDEEMAEVARVCEERKLRVPGEQLKLFQDEDFDLHRVDL